jgi:hypothetical protein
MKAKVLLTLVTAALLMNVGLNLVPSPRLTLLGGGDSSCRGSR